MYLDLLLDLFFVWIVVGIKTTNVFGHLPIIRKIPKEYRSMSFKQIELKIIFSVILLICFYNFQGFEYLSFIDCFETLIFTFLIVESMLVNCMRYLSVLMHQNFIEIDQDKLR